MKYHIKETARKGSGLIWVTIVSVWTSEMTWPDAPDRDTLQQMQAWCEQTQCGRRMSYDQFAFKNKKQLSFFMLRWHQ